MNGKSDISELSIVINKYILWCVIIYEYIVLYDWLYQFHRRLQFIHNMLKKCIYLISRLYLCLSRYVLIFASPFSLFFTFLFPSLFYIVKLMYAQHSIIQ